MRAEQLKKVLDILDDAKIIRYDKEITDIELSMENDRLIMDISPSSKDDKKPLPIKMIYKLLEAFPDAVLKTWGEMAQHIEIDDNKTIELKKWPPSH